MRTSGAYTVACGISSDSSADEGEGNLYRVVVTHLAQQQLSYTVGVLLRRRVVAGVVRLRATWWPSDGNLSPAERIGFQRVAEDFTRASHDLLRPEYIGLVGLLRVDEEAAQSGPRVVVVISWLRSARELVLVYTDCCTGEQISVRKEMTLEALKELL